MSLIDDINRASSRVNRTNQRANENVQKVTRVTGGFENAVGNYSQSVSNVRRTVSNTVRQFSRTVSGIGRVISRATGNQPGQAGTPGTGGGSTSRQVGSVTVKGEATSGIAGSISEGLIGVGVVDRCINDTLGGVARTNNEGHKTFEDTISNINRATDYVRDFENPYDLMKKRKAPQGFITFPIDLTQVVDSWMNIHFYEYTRDLSDKEGKKAHIFSITLPIPNNYTQDHTIRIESQDIGLLGLGEETFNELRNSFQGGEGFGPAVGNTIKSLTNNFDQKIGYAFFAGLNKVEPDLGGLVSQQLGQVPNPHPTVFFKGMELRKFDWTWKFVPRSEDEAKQLQAMLQLVKQFSLPSKNGYMLKYPSILKPEFGGAAKDKLGKFKHCMVSGFSINYSPEGTSSFFYDGHPVSMSLTLGLQEIEQFLAEDTYEVQQAYRSEFVGPPRRQ